MQLLYAKSRDNALTLSDLLRRYGNYERQTFELYLLNFHHLIEVLHYSVKDEVNRRAKILPSEEDKKFTAKLYNNELVQSFLASGRYDRAIQKFTIRGRIEPDTTFLFYKKFVETDGYKNYIKIETPTEIENRQVVLELYKFLYTNEVFNDLMEELTVSWIDDDTLIVGATKKTIKSMPALDEFYDEPSAEDRMTLQFGEELLTKTYKNDKELLDEIEPMLKNWDAERVATLDMILMKMALAELLHFPTIPTKVTINEYVDLSKMYSTDKSKDFVNGIMDRLMKKLKETGGIVKEGRGLVE